MNNTYVVVYNRRSEMTRPVPHSYSTLVDARSNAEAWRLAERPGRIIVRVYSQQKKEVVRPDSTCPPLSRIPGRGKPPAVPEYSYEALTEERAQKTREYEYEQVKAQAPAADTDLPVGAGNLDLLTLSVLENPVPEAPTREAAPEEAPTEETATVTAEPVSPEPTAPPEPLPLDEPPSFLSPDVLIAAWKHDTWYSPGDAVAYEGTYWKAGTTNVGFKPTGHPLVWALQDASAVTSGSGQGDAFPLGLPDAARNYQYPLPPPPNSHDAKLASRLLFGLGCSSVLTIFAACYALQLQWNSKMSLIIFGVSITANLLMLILVHLVWNR